MALQELEILDTQAEFEYDELAKLAAVLCGTPMAGISFVDDRRSWFKSSIGMDLIEVPRSLAPCDRVIQDPSGILVVENIHDDPWFVERGHRDHPQQIGFYAGAPLVTSGGHAIGTVCVFDRKPNRLNSEQSDGLLTIARQVVALLELRLANRRSHDKSILLARALDMAEAASRAKSRFLGNISHELRTPLNGVLGMADLLSHTPLTDRQKRYLETIKGSGEGLLAVLTDVIEFSETEGEQRAIEYRDTALPFLIDEVIALVRSTAQRKGLALHREVDPRLILPVRADSLKLRNVLTNLITNAVKFTPIGSVSVRARQVGSPQGAVVVRFEIEDTGIGIAPEDLGIIFEEFRQADQSESRNYGGAGLGLSISRNLIRLLGGEVAVRSEIGKGSCFFFELEFDLSETGPGGQPREILVVDDNEVNTLVIGALLEEMGCNVRCVQSGQEALDAIEHQQFDLVFMDVNMPVMDGLTATRELRAREADLAHLPIVAVTAGGILGDETRCLEAGMDGYLKKPINEKSLSQALEKFFVR